ncbi:hypothetical protein LCGC14_0851140 [marine sediment metagenome]|uniref:J domain-containing protein n=1 Tax=marine sediment metagenome TaxID=412755 RepID=A0A0F9SH95_9ZZZZ
MTSLYSFKINFIILDFLLIYKKNCKNSKKMDKFKDYYNILGVEKDASEEEIKQAYRRLAKKYHPDLNKTDPKAKEKFIKVHEAYETLINPIKREIYNQTGNNPQNIDISDLFWKYDSLTIREILRQIYYRKPYAKPPPEGMYV